MLNIYSSYKTHKVHPEVTHHVYIFKLPCNIVRDLK